MPHINLPDGFPGISAGFNFRPETAKPMRELAHILLHEPSSLTPGERELIATYVSSLNDCYFCQTVHGAIAAAHLSGDEDLVRSVKVDFGQADISDKLKTLLQRDDLFGHRLLGACRHSKDAMGPRVLPQLALVAKKTPENNNTFLMWQSATTC